MSATVVPFPVRHRPRWAADKLRIASRFPRRSQEWLETQVLNYRSRLVQLGVDLAIVEKECLDLETMLFGSGAEEKRSA
jgi:hypothetical protein